MTGARVAIAGLLVLLGLLVFSFFQLYERVEETIDTGYSEEARRNPYLAAKQYLDKLGREVETSTEMTVTDNLDPAETLFITNASTVRSQERIEQLLLWVEDGGHLILAANSDDVDNFRGLMFALGVSVDYIPAKYSRFRSCQDLNRFKDRGNSSGSEEESVSEILEQINAESNQQSGNTSPQDPEIKPENCLDRKYQARLDFTGVEGPFYVHFPGALGFDWDDNADDQPFYYAEDEAGIRFAQIERGTGLVSLLSSPVIWRSSNIALFDNAYLMWMLSEAGSRFHILHGSAMPSLISQIWRRGYEFVIAGLLMLILWVWYVGKRVQPSRDPKITHRRSVLEHLQARGEYLWKNAEYEALILPLKEDILQKCRQRIPAFYGASTNQQIHLISTTCDLDIRQVEQLFSDTNCENAQQCQQRIEIAQRIRNRI